MIHCNRDQVLTLKDWFVPDRATWMVGLHVIQTGNGACIVDRWPNPKAVLSNSGRNYSLVGDPDALRPEDLKGSIDGIVYAPAELVPLLKETFPNLKVWERVICELQERPRFSLPSGYTVRRLVSTDSDDVAGLSPGSGWISETWSGPAGLAASGYAIGAFADGRLVSLACAFFLGEQYEEIGVLTEPDFRGLGLSVACAGALCEDIQHRGHRPSWSTSPNNKASLRVAEKLGFSLRCRGHLYVVREAES